MLKLRTYRALNCAANGVLYHYTSSMDNVESILENGLRTSAYPTTNSDEYLAGISLSRTKTTIPYSVNDTHTHGYALDDEGSEFRRWVYGVIFSKRLLSNIGKIKPYHYATDPGWYFQINIRRVNSNIQELPKDWLPEKVTLDIVTNWRVHGAATARARIRFFYPEDTVDTDDYYTDEESVILEDMPYLPIFSEGISKEDYLNQIASLDKLDFEHNTPIDNANMQVDQYLKTVNLSDTKAQPQIVQDILEDAFRIIRRRIQGRQSHQKKSRAGNATKIWADGAEPVYLEDKGDTSYQAIMEALKQLQEIAPNIKISGNEQEGWRVYGKLPEGTSFQKLPITIQKIMNKLGMLEYESEDRILLPNAKPGEYIPATKKAIIGIIVPRSQYSSKEVQDFRQKHPDVPVHVYADKNEKSSDSYKSIPRSAYQNPIT